DGGGRGESHPRIARPPREGFPHAGHCAFRGSAHGPSEGRSTTASGAKEMTRVALGMRTRLKTLGRSSSLAGRARVLRCGIEVAVHLPAALPPAPHAPESYRK